ncbi:IclR family transcriptional regulator [Nitratireductor aestuarii]|uniref:IclR family transcriptional regulator n=1 Tax=Nitratireductor aestuarii TaxID=1735103 RepID=A0A916RY30_9HYPH|nr:helix-turn-helix domain-containing protein [Nitratireductor aestuarii]GGA75031.1 IclR family transcriptional regulator [Nitratireductor aestuarii]
MSAPQETQGTQILDRTVGILRSVSYGGDAGARLSDIAADCNLPAPTVRRILKRLVELGMLAQDAETRRYFVGTFLSELSERTPHYGNVFEPYMPFVDEVHAGCGDTIYLLAQSGHDCYCACRKEASYAIRMGTLQAGQRLPLGIGAGSVAAMADLPDDDIEFIIRDNIMRYRRYGDDFPDRLRRMIEDTRRDGFCFSPSPVTPEVYGLGVLLPRVGTAPRLGISVATVRSRLEGDARRMRLELIERAIERHLSSDNSSH